MSKEIFDALKSLEVQNGIDSQQLIEKIKAGMMRAIKHDYPYTENVRVEIDPETETFSMGLIKTVTDGEPEDPDNEISLDEAKTYDTSAFVGGVVEIPLNPLQLHRVAASSAKQSIRSDIKQYERERLIEQYRDKEHEIVTAIVQKVEPATGNAIIAIDKDEIYFPNPEHIPGETYKPGEHIKVYVVSIRPDKKPYVRVSRSHQDFVKRLFELEVPEIYDGSVEIKSIAREAGSRTKLAVSANDPNVDPVGACIGPRKTRVTAVMRELGKEKIDIIPYSDDDAEFISRALAPAEVINVTIKDPETRSCVAVVPDSQLSLAIGNRGQNAKLAARLTKYKIDIVSLSQASEAELSGDEEPKEDVNTAEAAMDAAEETAAETALENETAASGEGADA